tara:strand:- start:11038 stop:12228 length:1191 start_codon:yes stop_codon:yes gene_type:complete
MTEERLIAEITDDKIQYIFCKSDDNSAYKILKKKISENNGIRKGKILDFESASKKINNDVRDIEKELNKIFKNISIIINEPETFCTNLSGFKKLNGSKVERKDLEYILNEAKSYILKNQEKNSIIHILNSNFTLDKIKANKIPLGLHGDHLSLHITFISLPTNNLKNIKALFNSCDLKIDRVISKPLVCGLDLLAKNKNTKNFVQINFNKESSSISLFENSSLVFLKIFPFGTNSIYRDVIQLCSINEKEIRNIIKKINLNDKKKVENQFIDKNFFTESDFKKLSVDHLKNIIEARIIDMLDYIFNKNKNLNYINRSNIHLHLFFEDDNILENLGEIFVENFKIDKKTTQIHLLKLNDFLALSGAAELIFKGWDKEAIPLIHKKKSLISSFFERFF